jgi:hypothetical protein
MRISVKEQGCHFCHQFTKWQHYYSIIPPFFFFFNNDDGKAENQELGRSVSLSAAFCWQGALYGARSSDSCVLVDSPIAVLWTVLERVIFLEVQLVKLLISNSRHAV